MTHALTVCFYKVLFKMQQYIPMVSIVIYFVIGHIDDSLNIELHGDDTHGGFPQQMYAFSSKLPHGVEGICVSVNALSHVVCTAG